MNHKDITSAYNTVCQLLEKRQLKETFDRIETLAQALLIWQLQEKLNEQKETYRWMLKYSVDGVNDPEQKKIYTSLLANCYRIVEEVKEDLLSINSHNFVYSQKRYLPHIQHVNINDLASELENATANAGLPGLLEQSLKTKGKQKEFAIQHEELTNQLFQQCWLTAKYTESELNLFKTVMLNEQISVVDKCMAVSALTLSLMRYFDEERLLLLIEQCTNEREEVSQRALVGLLPVLAKYDSRLILFPAIRNRLVVLIDNSSVLQHLKRIILQYARTNETEKISRKLKEEILPEMMKVAPQIREKIDIDSLIKNEDPDEKNPEWQEMLENSGIADKLKEFSELQMDGADVYMSTFAMLKNFPFFYEVCNWFRPFDHSESHILELFEGDGNPFLSAMMTNGYMCNSDRYSFCLSLMQMPETQRSVMSNAFTSEAEQLKEIQKEDAIINTTKKAEFESNAYIQDLYRFFNLFQYKDDFENPFSFSLKLHNTWFFALIGFEPEDVRQIAEYYFAKDFFSQALELFEKIETNADQCADLLQKIGYCYQQLNDIENALHNYLEAEIISPNNKWTIRRIAYCYRLLADYPNALEYYLKSEQFYPENINIQIQIGNCYLNNKQYDKALSYYFKIEYATTDNVKVWRAIAWTSFLGDKLQQAEKFYGKIIELKPEWTDYLNAGHVAWAVGNRKQAVEHYKQAITTNELGAFIKSFTEDSKYLEQKGIDSTDIAIMLDYLRYFVEEK
ncbi:MAG: hypothetical protein P4L28_03800 [Paludibacteraceae bacterium]|nr:hypothetical protein [Paludibacteraceae bacterium]